MEKATGASSSCRKTCRQSSSSLHEEGVLQETIQQMLAKEAAIRRQGDHVKLNDAHAEVAGIPNLVWREKVAHWCYGVVDHLNESRSVVYVAMNILDRYCAVSASDGCSMDERTYEMASMTAIFLAVRIAGSGNLCLQELTSMSRGQVRVRDIISTGTSMIKILTWEHRIVTPLDFVGVWLDLISEDLRSQHVFDSACYLVEIAVCDSALSPSKASDVALAAVMNSLGETPSDQENFAKAVKQATGIVFDTSEFSSLRARLQGIYSQSADSSSKNDEPHLIDDECREPVQAICQPSILVASISSDELEQIYEDETNKRQLDSSPSSVSVQLKRTKYTYDVPALH
jgi:hypothetical protein